MGEVARSQCSSQKASPVTPRLPVIHSRAKAKNIRDGPRLQLPSSSSVAAVSPALQVRTLLGRHEATRRGGGTVQEPHRARDRGHVSGILRVRLAVRSASGMLYARGRRERVRIGAVRGAHDSPPERRWRRRSAVPHPSCRSVTHAPGGAFATIAFVCDTRHEEFPDSAVCAPPRSSLRYANATRALPRARPATNLPRPADAAAALSSRPPHRLAPSPHRSCGSAS